MHVISTREALSTSEPSVLVSTKIQKFKILEVKENPPQPKLALSRKKPRPPDRIWNPLFSLKKEEPRRVLRNSRETRG